MRLSAGGGNPPSGGTERQYASLFGLTLPIQAQAPMSFISLVRAGFFPEFLIEVVAMGFIHLHVHSQYSFLDGASSLDSLLEKAKALEMRGC